MTTIGFDLAVSEFIRNTQLGDERCWLLTTLKVIWARIKAFFAPNSYLDRYTFADYTIVAKRLQNMVTLYSDNMIVSYVFRNGSLEPEEKWEFDTKSKLAINTAVANRSITRTYHCFHNADLKILLDERMLLNCSSRRNNWGVTRTMDSFANLDLCEIVQKIKRIRSDVRMYCINFKCKLYFPETQVTWIDVTIHHNAYLNDQSNASIERRDGGAITYRCFGDHTGIEEVIDALMPIIELMI